MPRKSRKTNQGVVYWLYDDDCRGPEIDGYVGATTDLHDREFRHRKSKRFPSGFKIMILFQGHVDECLDIEKFLRPDPSMGWNEFGGGANGYEQSISVNLKKGKSLRGRKFSREHRRSSQRKKIHL